MIYDGNTSAKYIVINVIVFITQSKENLILYISLA